VSKSFHFISGLPRSGTTLLSTILKQNPRFEASISGPAARLAQCIHLETQAQAGYKAACTPERRERTIRACIDGYYAESPAEVIFDTSRGWTRLTNVVRTSFPGGKIICCVRDVSWIFDSFERLWQQNGRPVTSLWSPEEALDVYKRFRACVSEDRVIDFALAGLREAVFGPDRDLIMLVEYGDLATNPAGVMADIYDFIGEEPYAHDFNNVEASYDEFDADVNLKGMHTTRRAVSLVARSPIVPPDIWQAAEQLSFWKQYRLDVRFAGRK
jgi:sulfotransferase